MLTVVNSLFKTYLSRYRRELRGHYEEPLHLQAGVLQDILRYNRATAFGREHDFARLMKDPPPLRCGRAGT